MRLQGLLLLCFFVAIFDACKKPAPMVNTTPPANGGLANLPASIQFVAVPTGTFMMGGTTMANDASVHQVTLSAYELSEKEITNSEYLAFLNAALSDGWVEVQSQQTADPCGQYTENMVVGIGSAPNAGQVFLQLGETGGCTSNGESEHINNKNWIRYNSSSSQFELIDAAKGDWPINWLKWYGAHAFAEYYNVKLPSEAQWEYAARSGQDTVNYPTATGQLDSSLANYNGDLPGVHNDQGHAIAVGSYAPNSWGFYDMGGNVWEWCSDYYDAGFYQNNVTDPINTSASSNAKRVRRGGSWNYHAATLLTYARASDFENRGNNHFGFRIAK